MCVSAPVDLAVGAAVVAVAVDALRHVRERRDVALAALPLVLGAHQLIEAVVWLGVDGHVARSTMQTAVAMYLVVAFALPVLVPAVVLGREDDPVRRRVLTGLLLVGGAVTTFLLATVARGPVGVMAAANVLEYEVGVPWAGPVSVLYVVAACGSLLASGEAVVARFGLANLVAVPVIGILALEAFVSLWCFWAAAVSVAIALHLRAEASPQERPGTALPADS